MSTGKPTASRNSSGGSNRPSDGQSAVEPQPDAEHEEHSDWDPESESAALEEAQASDPMGDPDSATAGLADLVEDEGDSGDTAEAAAQTTALVSTTRSLAVRDPLQAYMNEARRYPLLSREEEHALAVRYFEEGDVDAARELVTANLRLVVKIAHEYRKAYRNLLDLVQEGNIGLMHAVKKFDPYKGVKLSSYAAWWIRAYILKFVLNNWRLVKIGTTQNQRKLFFNLRKEVENLRRMGIDEPGPKLLAERLDVPEHEVRSMQKRLAGSDVSLDAPVRGQDQESSAERIDFIMTDSDGPDQQVEEREFSQLIRDKVQQFGETLSGRDKEIFELRTVATEPLTLQEVGDRYGITRERARQIERRMMDRLRDFLREELGDAVDVALGSDA
jgi:RNA polymerase sigma-32 factor